MAERPPDFWGNLKGEFAAGRHWIALLTGVGPQQAIPLIALGMVGFLAAATQEPITAFIIVMEMIAGQTMVLSLMAPALLASGISRMLTRPMYSELMLMILPPRPESLASPNPR